MKRIAIIGAGESGVGAAILAKKEGWDVWVSDYGQIAEKYKKELVKYGITFEENDHDLKNILAAKLVVKSPGVSSGVAIMKSINDAKIPVVSEIEFGSRYTDAKIIGITGSNGKTTTTLLTYHLLKAAGLNVGLAGNIGDSFAKSVALNDFDFYVLEISSFQLDDVQLFKCDIAMLLNISADHLDRYEYNAMLYAKAKLNIINNQKEDDLFIFNGKDEVTISLIKDLTLDQRMMPVLEPVKLDSKLYLGGDLSFDLKNFSLKGVHNLTNLTFALLAALDLGALVENLQKGIDTFTNAPHRMEFVRKVNSVDYINDSKATNVDAVYYALQAIEKPIVWIVGGVDKGNDYNPLLELVEEKVRGLIFLGIDNAKLFDFFAKLDIPTIAVNSAENAVMSASRMAHQGDTVLLSPACASFDLFNNYEHRGDLFKKAVLGL